MTIIEQLFGTDDRRRSERLPQRPDLALIANGEKVEIINISGHGIRFVMGKHHKANEMLLEIFGSRHSQKLVARKVWSEEVGPKHQVVGVQIVKSFEKRVLSRSA